MFVFVLLVGFGGGAVSGVVVVLFRLLARACFLSFGVGVGTDELGVNVIAPTRILFHGCAEIVDIKSYASVDERANICRGPANHRWW